VLLELPDLGGPVHVRIHSNVSYCLIRDFPQYSINDVALQHVPEGPLVYLVVVAWIYVALMMAVAEASHAQGTVLGAVFTFVLYGVGPVALLIYLMGRPARRAARASREAAAAQLASGQPDGGGQPSADAIPPVRKEP
jgi:hypothetical protein